MTLPTHERAFLSLAMAVFAVHMKGLDQAGFAAAVIGFMAIRTALVLG